MSYFLILDVLLVSSSVFSLVTSSEWDKIKMVLGYPLMFTPFVYKYAKNTTA